jgi:hypothetical protein
MQFFSGLKRTSSKKNFEEVENNNSKLRESMESETDNLSRSLSNLHGSNGATNDNNSKDKKNELCQSSSDSPNSSDNSTDKGKNFIVEICSLEVLKKLDKFLSELSCGEPLSTVLSAPLEELKEL